MTGNLAEQLVLMISVCLLHLLFPFYYLAFFNFSFFFTSSIAALFQVVIRLHGYVSGARTRFWRTAEAGGRRGERIVNM
jgi:hypothetical protein